MDFTQFQKQVSLFKNARTNVLIVTILTAVNFFLGLVDSEQYFLFSAFLPLFLGDIVPLALMFVLAYFLFWLLSKRARGLIVAALVLFSVDTAVFLILMFATGFEVSYLLDIAFHTWFIVSLAMGAMAWSKLKGVDVEAVEASIKQEQMQQAQLQQAQMQQAQMQQQNAPYDNNNPYANQPQNTYQAPQQNEFDNQQ